MKGDEFLAWVPTEYSGSRALGWVDGAASLFHVGSFPFRTDNLPSIRAELLDAILAQQSVDPALDFMLQDRLAEYGSKNIELGAIVVHEYKHFFDMLSTATGLARLRHLLTDTSIFVEAWRNNGRAFAGHALMQRLNLPPLSPSEITDLKNDLSPSPSIEAWWHLLHRTLHRLRVVRDGDVLVPQSYQTALLDSLGRTSTPCTSYYANSGDANSF